MNQRLDLTDLRLFVNAVETGSITAGAEASHMALASASARVIGLERALNTALLQRGRRGVQVTAAGQVLLSHARAVLQQAEQMRSDIALVARRQITRVRLVGNSSAVREYLPDALGDFLGAHPQANVELEEMVPDAAVSAVLDGAADLAVVVAETTLRGLQAVDYRNAGFAVLVPRGHPMVGEASRGPVTMQSTDKHDVVGLLEGSALQATWEARAAQRGNRLNYRARVPSFEAQARLIERGVGVALMPRSTAERLARGRAVEVIPMADPFLNQRLLLCARDWSTLSAPATELVNTLLGRAAV